MRQLRKRIYSRHTKFKTWLGFMLLQKLRRRKERKKQTRI
nr:MAG TPA: hypothetical protein [Caudoviricetes sp.]